MKNALFNSINEEHQMTTMVAAVVLHGLVSGRAASHLPAGEASIVDTSFDIAARFIARAKELSK